MRCWLPWRKAAKGQAQVVLISGEAGIGKTRLAEELLARLDRQGIETAVAHCYAEGGPSVAYGPVAGMAAKQCRAGQDALAGRCLARRDRSAAP